MINIKFVKKENRAVAYDDEIEIGECQFEEQEEEWNIVHTGVNSKYQGKGIAKKLVKSVIENARIFNKNLISECSYAKKIIKGDNLIENQ